MKDIFFYGLFMVAGELEVSIIHEDDGLRGSANERQLT